MGVSWTPMQLRTAGNVLAISRKYQQLTAVPDLVQLAVTYNESSWDENAVNTSDPGGSYGPYQLNGQAHPPAPWLGPSAWYDYGFAEIWSRWQRAWQRANGPAAWQAGDPNTRALILEEFAPDAQGSIAWPAGRGQICYSASLAMLEVLS